MHATKCRADQNDDNLQISKAYMRISDYCRVTVWVRITVADCGLRFELGLPIVVCKLLEKVTKCGSVT